MALQLTAASLVLRHFVHSDELGPIVSSFLGPSPTLSFSQACSFRSIKLLDWIWHSSCSPRAAPPPGWSLCNHLRSEKNYRWWQAWKSLQFVAETGALEVLEWVYRHFSGCLVPVEVVEIAARNGHLEALKFLLKHDAGRSWKHTRAALGEEERWYETNAEAPDGWNGPGLVVDWGGRSLVGAIKNGRSDVARWLVKCAPHRHNEEEMKLAIEAAMKAGDFKLAEWLVPAGKHLVSYAGSCQRVEAIEMLLNAGLLRLDKRYAAQSLSEAASAGRLDLIERIVQLFSPPRPQLSHDWIVGWCRAMQKACWGGHLELLEWLVNHPTGQQVCTARDRSGCDEVFQQFFVLAAEQGHVEILDFLFKKGYVAQCEVALVGAVRNDHLEAVKWLVHNCSFSASNPTACAVQEAAKGGRLKVLQHLHGMAHTAASPDYFIGRWSHRVMDLAAGQSHLDVVSWLSKARSEGCSTQAMDGAAANGHLAMIKWLHCHRSEGCTRAAMDGAAAHGFLDVVQWLDANTEAGCTTKAMDGAAKNGHLQVLKWLLANRTEGCSVDAMNDAVESSHTHVVWWLHHRLPRLTPSKKNVWIQAPNQFDMLLLLDRLYPTMFDTENGRRPTVGIRSELNDVLAVQWLYDKIPGDFLMLQQQQ